ncbi:MAG TPA: helix-turn-helix transcriptional regulator [Burkholderiaceae bacterium]|nr:helix-turn-helix transcriptional regulator [Burkholderiaceae bacterium]
MAVSPQRAFGERVRELRLAGGLTQDDLAERCGLFRTYLSRIETGRANPTLTMIDALASSLGVPIVALFGVPATPVEAKRPAVRPARGRVSR